MSEASLQFSAVSSVSTFRIHILNLDHPSFHKTLGQNPFLLSLQNLQDINPRTSFVLPVNATFLVSVAFAFLFSLLHCEINGGGLIR
jgi:hypothetical protein